MADTKKRCARVSRRQKEILADFMFNNKEFARGQFKNLNSRQTLNDTWESLASQLNSNGPIIKSVEQWKKCWTDIKASTKKQANQHKAFRNKTGGGSIFDGPHPLSDFDEKVLAVMSLGAVNGDASTPELGFNNSVVENLEIVLDAAPDESDPEFEEPCPKRNKMTQRTSYEGAMEIAKKWQEELEKKMDFIIAQNNEILAILKSKK